MSPYLHFKLVRSCPLHCHLLKVLLVYPKFLEQNVKAASNYSMEQLGVPCVKQGFCYFNCNIFYFGRIFPIIAIGYSVGRQLRARHFAFLAVDLFLMSLCRMFQNKKIFGHTCHFQGWVDGLNRKRDSEILRGKLGMDIAPKKTEFPYYLVHLSQSSYLILLPVLMMSKICFFRSA